MTLMSFIAAPLYTTTLASSAEKNNQATIYTMSVFAYDFHFAFCSLIEKASFICFERSYKNKQHFDYFNIKTNHKDKILQFLLNFLPTQKNNNNIRQLQLERNTNTFVNVPEKKNFYF
jgi:hypothetical protein